MKLVGLQAQKPHENLSCLGPGSGTLGTDRIIAHALEQTGFHGPNYGVLCVSTDQVRIGKSAQITGGMGVHPGQLRIPDEKDNHLLSGHSGIGGKPLSSDAFGNAVFIGPGDCLGIIRRRPEERL